MGFADSCYACSPETCLEVNSDPDGDAVDLRLSLQENAKGQGPWLQAAKMPDTLIEHPRRGEWVESLVLGHGCQHDEPLVPAALTQRGHSAQVG